jgi:hypothetical protein
MLGTAMERERMDDVLGKHELQGVGIALVSRKVA